MLQHSYQENIPIYWGDFRFQRPKYLCQEGDSEKHSLIYLGIVCSLICNRHRILCGSIYGPYNPFASLQARIKNDHLNMNEIATSMTQRFLSISPDDSNYPNRSSQSNCSVNIYFSK